MNLEIDFSANKDCADIVLEVHCNNKKISEYQALAVKQTVCVELDEDPADHVLRLVMRGKNQTHTVFDDQDQITDDVFIVIDRLEFEELDMREIFCQGQLCYTHSFNQNQPAILDEFYGLIGCNGTVDIKFFTPIFLWLNEYLH
jgi:hypothetical protein